jgi:hypothetical protein
MSVGRAQCHLAESPVAGIGICSLASKHTRVPARLSVEIVDGEDRVRANNPHTQDSAGRTGRASLRAGQGVPQASSTLSLGAWLPEPCSAVISTASGGVASTSFSAIKRAVPSASGWSMPIAVQVWPCRTQAW